jgi:hypothetical protein
MAACAALVGLASRVTAQTQAAVTVSAGATTADRIVPGAKLAVPITLDLTAGGGFVRSIAARFAWDPGVIALDSITPGSFAPVSADMRTAPVGTLLLAATAATDVRETASLATLYFTGVARGGTRITVTPTTGASTLGVIVNGQLVGRGEDICVAPHALWGDADGDGTVTIIDAQQIARSTVGAPVIDQAALSANGDVNADSTVDILDAQGIARFAVHLDAPARVGVDQGEAPTVASIAVNHSTVTVSLTQTTALLATPSDADGFTVVGCQPVTWSSSNPSIARVNEVGKVTGVAAGTATITARSGSATATSVVTVTAPDATAVLTRLRNITAGGITTVDGIWLLGGLMTDEWKSSDTFTQRNAIDQRAVADDDLLVRNNLRELLHAISDARTVAETLNGTGTDFGTFGQMLFVEGYAELMLAEAFCSGVSITSRVGSLLVEGPQVTNADIFARAIAHFDSAIAYGTAGGATVVVNDAHIAKGRALVGLGRFVEARAEAANVATQFVDLSTVAGTESNKIWLLNNSQKRYTVGDDLDVAGRIANALDFASAADPRLAVFGSSTGTSPAGLGFDGTTNFVSATGFTQTGRTPLLMGQDARLIEAEAALNVNDLAGMTAILNSLRASLSMPPLTAPTTLDTALDLLFRERAFWTFGRGQRLGDLRRLVRVYGRAPSAVYPAGTFFKGGAYGTALNFPATVDEDGNTGLACFDRNP